MKISAQCSALGFSNSSFQDFDEIDYTCWTQNPALHTQVCHCPQFLLYPPGKLADSLPLQRPPVLEKTSTNLEGAGRGAWPLRAQPCGTCSSRGSAAGRASPRDWFSRAPPRGVAGCGPGSRSWLRVAVGAGCLQESGTQQSVWGCRCRRETQAGSCPFQSAGGPSWNRSLRFREAKDWELTPAPGCSWSGRPPAG